MLESVRSVPLFRFGQKKNRAEKIPISAGAFYPQINLACSVADPTPASTWEGCCEGDIPTLLFQNPANLSRISIRSAFDAYPG